MGTIYKSAEIDVPASKAWTFLERYTRSEVHVFSNCVSERQDGEYRVVNTVDGMEIWELNVAIDNEHMRASYTIAGLFGGKKPPPPAPGLHDRGVARRRAPSRVDAGIRCRPRAMHRGVDHRLPAAPLGR
jgi:hypothetical protein